MNSLRHNEIIWDVYEALDDLKFWRPIYKALLRRCGTKAEALEALRFLIRARGAK